MWDNDFKRVTIRNVILAVLTIAVLGFLAYAMRTVNANRAQRDKALSEVSTQRQEEQNANMQDAVSAILAEYQKDVETVNTYVPGIVCWGDALTAGSSGNVSYPDVLKEYIDEEICSAYDFESTMMDKISSTSMYSSFDWDNYKIDIPVVNMGTGEENIDTIMGRCGVRPYVISEDFVIPADTEAVGISFTSPDGGRVEPLTNGNVGVNNVSIGGVEGTISIDTVSVGGNLRKRIYSFSRCEAGAETKIPAGTEIITAASDLYKDYIHVVWVGTYGGYEDAQDLVKKTRALVDRQCSNKDRFIVIGLCVYNGYWDISTALRLDRLDTALAQEFGSNYINLRKYLCSDGLSDAGLNPTQTDNRNILNGCVPTSFRSSSGTPEFNAKAYNLIGKLVYDRMNKLGFFDEIREELGINKIAAGSNGGK